MAAPKLRILSATIGPVPISIGSNGPAYSVATANIGDGALNLSVTSSASWIAVSLGTPFACSLSSTPCTPLLVALNTSTLAKGTYAGLITLSDPNAIDAPQTIAVTVLIGGGVPDAISLLVAPGAAPASLNFDSSCALSRTVASPPNGPGLSLAITGTGSFDFTCSYTLSAKAPPGLPDGGYAGSFTLALAKLAEDNKTVPVTVKCTSQPIASGPAALRFRIAQNTPAQTSYFAVDNRGLGTLAVSGVTATGGSWLAVQWSRSYAVVTADPAGLAPGTYFGKVTVASNAANPALDVPVELNVRGTAPPLAYFQGVVNNGDFEAGDNLAPGELVALFGEQLTTGTPQQAGSLPLPAQLGGAKVLVNGLAAPIYYVSANQINLQIPFETALGDATVQVSRDGQPGNTVSIRVVKGIPRLLRLGIDSYGVILNQDGSFAIPTTPGLASHPAKIGDTITIYALGLGLTTPAVASGAGAPSSPPFAVPNELPMVIFNRGIFTSYVSGTPSFVGLAPRFVGLYQINVAIPPEARTGDDVTIFLLTNQTDSNLVTMAIQ